ncbi:MAG: PorT family protein [Bacteroidales bacterium]|nr:PorT family protein [Bacteroidales bacterium]
MVKFIKCIAAVLAVILLSPSKADAQIYVGAEVGASISWIRGTVIYGYEQILPHNSAFGGLMAQYWFDSSAIVQAGLIYSGKGHSDTSEIDGKYSRNLSYLQLPLMAGARALDDKFSIMAGPEFGFLVNSTIRSRGKVANSTSDCNRFNLALGFQLAYEVYENLSVELKYDFALTDTFTGKFEGAQNTGRNMSVLLGLCYKFEL